MLKFELWKLYEEGFVFLIFFDSDVNPARSSQYPNEELLHHFHLMPSLSFLSQGAAKKS